jgi:hypothetical protein
MNKFRFKVGDLVREKKITPSQVEEFGIVTISLKIGDMVKYRCLWSNEREYWKKEANLYLVARGQNGSVS